MNGEYVCELVRAHYDNDTERFDTILGQIVDSPRTHPAVSHRLRDIHAAAKREAQGKR